MSESKFRYWWGICYPENMLDNWQLKIEELLQVPFCYIIHDKDNIQHASFKDDPNFSQRKLHVHLMLAFPNNTTKKHVLNMFNLLSAPDKVCCSTIQPMYNIKNCYDYLCHETKTALSDPGKFHYTHEERIEGNNFDLGAYISVSQEEKDQCLKDIYNAIIDSIDGDFPLYNFGCVTKYYLIDKKLPESSLEFQCLKGYKGLIVEWCKYVYFKKAKQDASKIESDLQAYQTLITQQNRDIAVLSSIIQDLHDQIEILKERIK